MREISDHLFVLLRDLGMLDQLGEVLLSDAYRGRKNRKFYFQQKVKTWIGYIERKAEIHFHKNARIGPVLSISSTFSEFAFPPAFPLSFHSVPLLLSRRFPISDGY